MTSNRCTPPGDSLPLRLASIGGVLILAVGYGVEIPMKAHGLLPYEVSYPRIVVGTLLIAGAIPIFLLLVRLMPHRVLLCCWIMCLATWLIFLVTCFLEEIFHR